MASVDQVRELQETVGQLEATLSTTRDTVKLLQEALNARETEIQQLRKKLKDQEGLLLRRMQIIAETKKERDDLRRKNAELILKQAEVGRKHSVNVSPPRLRSQYSSSSIFTPPSPSPSPSHKTPSRTTSGSSIRHNSLSKQEAQPLPSLPPTPEEKIEKPKPDEGSDTDYSDMEDDGKGKDTGKTAKNPGMRAVSPPADSPATAKRKISQPKPIIRSGVKAASENQPSAAGATFHVAQQNPKRKVVLGPPREALSSISEEIKTGLVANGDVAQVGRERHESMDSADSSVLFNSSMEMSPPVSPVKTEAAADNSLAFSRRRAISEAGFKKRTKSQEIPSEAEDVLGEMMDFEPMMRSRVSTVSTTTGRYKEIGRKNSKQLKQEAAKLSERSPNIRRSGRKLQELELISPDMELRIREKICSAIGKKYGGLRRANRAAIVIQTAYRQYKLKKRYEEIRKEAIHMRKRAQTMKDPRRRPSMVRRNRPARYRREISVLASNDPLLKTKLFSRELAKERVPHTSSRIHLVEQQRSQRAQSMEGRSERGKEGEVVENGQMEEVVEMESVVCKITLEDDGTPPMKTLQLTKGDICTDSTDSTLPTSFSTDVLLTSQGYQRPLSIFSLRPSMSMDASLGSEETRMIQTITQRPLSSDVRELKMAVGIGHFNKKPTRGIQYLVRESLLPDDPQYIATFMASQYGLSKEKIGEFVGEINSEFHMAVLECLLEQMDMKDKPIDEALREFQILFRMPGEAQKIDKIMQMFALEYFRFNKEGVIKSEDAAYILSFAIMMLHTSLHNPSVKNRTNKKQWVSMNRGCNDDDNFPEAFLLEIYDRISKREFTTGKDHTTVVSDIEKNLVGYQNTSKLAVPQRRLVCRAHVTEIDQLTSRPSFKNRRRRVLLIFNDQVIICKRRGGDQLEYRDSFTLLDAIAISFEASHYKSGIQIYSSHDEKAIFQCNCDSSEDRVKLLKTLEDTINELRDLENERMAELGTSISKTQEAEPERRHRIASRAGDLLSSARLNARDSVRSKRLSKGDFVSGVGDLAMSSGVATSNIIRRTSRSSGTSSPENRTSGGSHESGYDSQRTTPVPSPSPTNLSHSQPSPPPPPPSQRILRARPSTTSAPVTLITPVNPVTRSKSTDQINNIRVMSITPTLSREAKAKFSSAEDISRPEKNGSASNSPKTSKKKDKERKTDRPKTPKKSRMPSLSSPFRFFGSDRRGSSPGEIIASTMPQGRQRTSSQTPPPSSDLERSTHSMGSSRAMAYMVNTT